MKNKVTERTKHKVTEIVVFYMNNDTYNIQVERDHDFGHIVEYKNVSNFVLDKIEDLTQRSGNKTTIHITRGTPAIFIRPID